MSKIKNPLVSVYITNYNYGRYIREAIESVLSQTLQDFELLIIDDGSTDNSHEVIEEYSSQDRIRVVYQKNKGLNVTNNIAMRLAKGKYLVRLDADDFFSTNALEMMANKLEADDELGLVFPDYYLIDANGEKMGMEQRHSFDEDVSLLDQPAHGACTMVRRRFLADLGGYNESFSCQDGYDLWIKFTAHYKVANINEPLFFYRQHGSNLTKNEERLLSTRAAIKQTFVDNENIELPKTLGILPIRGEEVNRYSLAFDNFGGDSLIDIKIKQAIKTSNLDLLVVTSPDSKIEEYINEKYSSDKVLFIKRPKNLAQINKDLRDSVAFILNHKKISEENFQAFMLIFLEYPFVSHKTLDDAVSTMAIFGVDSLISVRQDNGLFYHHDGGGMKAIYDQDKFTKLEREAIYKFSGGIMLTKVEAFLRDGFINTGKVGHIVVNQKEAMGLFSDFDINTAKLIAEKERQSVS